MYARTTTFAQHCVHRSEHDVVLQCAGQVFENTVSFLSCEVNSIALEDKNEGSIEEIADRYVGKLLRAGFQVCDGSLLGPQRKDMSDVQAVLRELSKHRFMDLSLAKAPA